jgi:mono/diheme cytochrome c family protein
MIDLWIDSFYRIVNSFGFPDAVHPTLVHMPMGLVVGAFFLAWISFFSSWKNLAVTAYHCITLALLFLFPAIVFGFMDWRHFYLGAWLTPIIIKMVLAVVFFIFALAAFLFGFTGKEGSKIALALYTLCLITVVALGWFGARVVSGEPIRAHSQSYPIGEGIFIANCSTCHPNGSNKFAPDHPLRNSEALERFNIFLSQIRDPEKPMPAFTGARIPEKEAKDLYDYIVKEFNCPAAAGKGSHSH